MKYQTRELFLNDLNQIFENSKIYNGKYSRPLVITEQSTTGPVKYYFCASVCVCHFFFLGGGVKRHVLSIKLRYCAISVNLIIIKYRKPAQRILVFIKQLCDSMHSRLDTSWLNLVVPLLLPRISIIFILSSDS